MGLGEYAKVVGYGGAFRICKASSGPNHFFRRYLRITKGALEFRMAMQSDAPTRSGNSKRGTVKCMSAKSSKRLFILALNLTDQPEFWQTLTFADEALIGLPTVTSRAMYSSRILKSFKRGAERMCPGIVGLWRREWEPRKSGEMKGQYCPHYHFAYRIPGLDKGQYQLVAQRLARIWVNLTGAGQKALDVAQHPRSFEYLDGQSKVYSYISKYISKSGNGEGLPDDESYGRMWGRIGSPKEEKALEKLYGSDQAKWLKRALKRLAKVKYQSRKTKNGRTWRRLKGLFRRIEAETTWILMRRETFRRLWYWIEDEMYLVPF